MRKAQKKRLSEIHKKRFAEGATTWNDNAGKHTGQKVWNAGWRSAAVDILLSQFVE
jgi:hypothetical protein